MVKLKNADNTLSSPIIEGKFICKTSNSDNVIYADKDIQINSSDVGEIIITKPNVKVTFKAPFTEKSLTNIQKIKSITDNTASATLIFKGGDYYIERFKISDDERMPSFKVCKNGFKIQTPNNSRLFVKNFEIKNNKPIPLNISLNEENSPNALLIYANKNFNINTKGKLAGNFYLYGYSDITLKATPSSLIKGAIHAQGELSDLGVRVEYVKPKDMYKLIVCNTLPPIPDEDKNNKTLLGIDSNNNGIRDDVEIKILTFKPRICMFKPDSKECKISENPAFIAVSFQHARAFQTVLKKFDGSKKKAYELTKIEDRAVDCDSYFTIDNKYWYEYSGKLVEGWVLNTKERKNFYYEYDKQLSGGLFTIGKKSDNIKGCDFNVTEVESELQRGIK